MHPGSVLLGFVVAALVVVTGAGGGSLMTPALILLLGVSPPTAVGTDLIYAALTKVGALWVYLRQGKVCWRLVGWMLVGSVPATLAALALIGRYGGDREQMRVVVNLALSVALGATGFAILFRDQLNSIVDSLRPSPPLQLAAAGGAVGILVALSSVGAGTIGMAMLLFLAPTLEPGALIGTDLAHGVVVAAVAGLGHVRLGTPDFRLLAEILAGALPGIFAGSLLSRHLPKAVVQRLLAFALLGAALRLAVL